MVLIVDALCCSPCDRPSLLVSGSGQFGKFVMKVAVLLQESLVACLPRLLIRYRKWADLPVFPVPVSTLFVLVNKRWAWSEGRGQHFSNVSSRQKNKWGHVLTFSFHHLTVRESGFLRLRCFQLGGGFSALTFGVMQCAGALDWCLTACQLITVIYDYWFNLLFTETSTRWGQLVAFWIHDQSNCDMNDPVLAAFILLNLITADVLTNRNR